MGPVSALPMVVPWRHRLGNTFFDVSRGSWRMTWPAPVFKMHLTLGILRVRSHAKRKSSFGIFGDKSRQLKTMDLFIYIYNHMIIYMDFNCLREFNRHKDRRWSKPMEQLKWLCDGKFETWKPSPDHRIRSYSSYGVFHSHGGTPSSLDGWFHGML